ncbi:MAG: HD domain-containing phosphohydrolase [bacterium]
MVAHDNITERKLVEEALSEAKLQLELAFQAAGISCWDWERTTGRVYFSPAWKRQLGYNEEEVESCCVTPTDTETTQAREQDSGQSGEEKLFDGLFDDATVNELVKEYARMLAAKAGAIEQAFRAQNIGRLAGLAHELKELDLNDWQIEVAAMLSQIGCVSIPDHILVKAYEGRTLSHTERKIFESYPANGQQLVASIPRLEEVAKIIAYQQQHYDGQGVPGDGTSECDIPLGSRVLKIALDFDILIAAEYGKETAVAEMNYRPGWYDPSMLPALSNVLAITDVQVIRSVKIPQLVDGLILADDIVTRSGVLVCAKGQEVTRAMRFRLRNYLANIGIQSSVKVFVPAEMADSVAKRDCSPTVHQHLENEVLLP